MVKKLIRILLYSTVCLLLYNELHISTIIDPSLSNYDTEVMGYINKYCKDTQRFVPRQKFVYIAPLPDNIIGHCSSNKINMITVLFNSKNWVHLPEDMKFSTVAHEYVHCYFFQEHVSDPHNFMYYMENNLTRAEVMIQLEEYLREKCK